MFFMIFLLSFLLSWLSGLLVVLVVAFFSYDDFSIVDITSFAVFTLAGCLILIPLIYSFVIKFLKRKTGGRWQFFYFPASLVLLANLPMYIIILLNTNNLYGPSEALLFTFCFATTGLVFGVCMARKNKALKSR